MKKIITGIVLFLMIFTVAPIAADNGLVKITVADTGYSHGGWSEFVAVARMNKTGEVNSTFQAKFEVNIWVWNRTNEYTTEIGSPSYPNYTFTLRIYSMEYVKADMSSHQVIEELYVRNVTADPVYTSIDAQGDIDNDTVWLVRNETFDLKNSDFYEDPNDSWCYFGITYEGFGFNPLTGEPGTQADSRFLAHIEEKLYYSPDVIAEAQSYNPFTGWPREEVTTNETTTTTVTTPDIETTTETTPISYIFALAIAALVIVRKNKQGKG